MRRLLLLAVFAAGCAAQPDPHTSAPCSIATGTINGQVRHEETGEPVPNAIVVLMSTSLQQQREGVTNEQGLYAFMDLPPGTYTIQVLSGQADVSKIVSLPGQAKFRANFSLNPDRQIGCWLPVMRQLDDASMFSIDETEARLLGVPKTIRRL